MNAASLQWESAAVIAATGGRAVGDAWMAHGVAIDSRQVRAGDLFVALRGDRFDGHDFLTVAAQKGAVAALVEVAPAALPAGFPVVVVDNSLTALNQLAAAARRRLTGPVIAVTGSVGKTGSKESLARALAAFGSCHVNQGNLNNHIGAPLSLARAPAASDFCVLEMGMNHAGEISPLSRLAQPQVALITNVEPVHIGHFRDITAIADAKCEIFDGVMPGGVAILNRDNAMFDYCAAAAKRAGIERIISFGRDVHADVRLLECEAGIDGSHVRAHVIDQEARYHLRAIGCHWVLNSLGVLAAVAALGLDPAVAAAAMEQVTAGRGRGGQVDMPAANGGHYRLIDESYNASPPAVRAALSVLAMTPTGPGGRRIAVLGDMLELGAHSADLHADLAPDLFASGADMLFTAGPDMAQLRAHLATPLTGVHGAGAADIAAAVAAEVRAGDVVLVKGSLGMGMSAIIKALNDAAPVAAATAGGRGA